MPQRLVGHHRPEVGAADAHVDHRADRPAGVPLPGAAADLLTKRGHSPQHLVHVGHDIVAITENLLASWCTQRHVQHGAVLGRVDLLSGEHRVDPLPQTACLREPDQQRERLVGDPLLRIVDMQAAGVEHKPFAAAGIVREELPQVRAHLGRSVGGDLLPLGE